MHLVEVAGRVCALCISVYRRSGCTEPAIVQARRLEQLSVPSSIVAPPLDPAEKRRSRDVALASSAWGPDTHASVTPLRGIFRATLIAGLVGRGFRADATRKGKPL